MRLARFATNFGVGFLIGLTIHDLFPNFGINLTF